MNDTKPTTEYDPIAGNIREAVNNVLFDHRSPVYGSCSCGWPVPGYPHSNGSAHWRDHIADTIVARAFPSLEVDRG